MAVKFYLDTRRAFEDGTSSLRLKFTKDGSCAMITMDVRLRPDQWDAARQRVVKHPARAGLNALLDIRRAEADCALLRLRESPEWPRLTAAQVRDRIEGREPARRGDTFIDRFESFAALKANPRTRGVYELTLRHLRGFDPDAGRLTFGDISTEWLTRFDMHLARTSPSRNARNIHLRNIRAVFNAAIDDGVTTAYPFRRFKIRPAPTAHRALTPDQLRTLFSYPAEEYAVQYVDMFKLIFFLMGINMVDLYNLKEVTAAGRVEYVRAKTGRPYSVKVEPEAMEIIDRHRGRRNLLDIADRYASHLDYLHHMNYALKRIGPVTRSGLGGRKTVEPLFPNLSSYWARHSWATAAAGLDIPKETIAAGLGHGGNTVTDIYIDFDRRKVDAANRRVIDFVVHGRK